MEGQRNCLTFVEWGVVKMDDSQLPTEKTLVVPFYKNQSVLPDALLRGALFGVSQQRILVKEKLIFTQDGISICLTGETFNQTDLKVYEATISLYSKVKDGKGYLLTTYSHIAREIGWSRCGKNIEQIKNSIDRLINSTIWLKIVDKNNVRNFDYLGYLIDKCYFDEMEGKLRINFNHEIFPLFSPSFYCLVDKKIVIKLGKKQLACWLFRFYSTHANAYEMSFEYLIKMAGMKVCPETKRMIKMALENLKLVCDQVGYEFNYLIDDNKIKVVKQKSKSQTKFLEKRK